MVLLDEVEHWSLTTLLNTVIKIGAKVVRHGSYITFQIAEVAGPRHLFAEILRRIDGLRPGRHDGNLVQSLTDRPRK